jgi:hypothetical protein
MWDMMIVLCASSCLGKYQSLKGLINWRESLLLSEVLWLMCSTMHHRFICGYPCFQLPEWWFLLEMFFWGWIEPFPMVLEPTKWPELITGPNLVVRLVQLLLLLLLHVGLSFRRSISITGHPYCDDVAFDPCTSMICVCERDSLSSKKLCLQLLLPAVVCPSSIDQLVPTNLPLKGDEFLVWLSVPRTVCHWRVI